MSRGPNDVTYLAGKTLTPQQIPAKLVARATGESRRSIERRVEQQNHFPHTGARYSKLSVERFRALPRYHDRPAAADMAFCISALSLQMPEDAIMRALEDDYLSRDPNPSRRAAYIRRTLSKARAWARS